MPRSSLLNIPYEGTREVGIEAPPQVWQKIHVDEDMFGAGKGKALAQLGNAIGKIGDVIGDIDKNNQMEQADTKARELDTWLLKEHTNLREEYSRQEPDKAAAGFEDFDRRAREITEKANQAAAGNKHTQKIIGNHAEHYYQQTWKFGFGIKTEGVRKHADNVGDERVNQAIQSASAANDEKFLTDPDTGVFAIINGETYAKGRRNNWGEELTKAAAAKARSAAATAFIGNMARDNPTMAQQFRDKYDEHLSPPDKELLDRKIEAQTQAVTMQDAARARANGQPMPDLPRRPVPPPATIVEPPKGPGVPGHYKQKKTEAGSDEGTIQLASGGTIEFSAQTKLSPYNKPGVPIPGYHPEADSATVENYIAQQARLRGIDPGTALAVYKSEGSSQWKSTVPGENSWGPYQLFTGPSLNSDSGLGNEFYRKTGLDPRDPKTWRENIEWALNQVVENGWGKWNGAKAKGITGKQGVGEGARVIPVGASNMYQQSQVPEDYGEESSTVVGSEPAKNYGKTYATEVGERDAMVKPGSRIIHAYNTYGKIRTLPPDPQLETALDKAAKDAGVTFRITSGGQTHNHDPAKKNTPGGWTGSLRHDDGRAVDGDIMDQDGKVLARSDPRRLAFLEAAAKYGAGGTGAGYMDDPLKVHIGITGASGKVGHGLGAYAGNDAERQAVLRGLEGGGHDASTQFAQHGGSPASNEPGARVQLASASPGTMSDAPQPGFQPVQYAQYQPPPSAANRAPITADTPLAELNAMIKADRAQLRGNGYSEKDADSYETELRRLHQKALGEKADANKRAFNDITTALFGDALKGVPPAEDWDGIKKDPELSKAWDALEGPQKKHFADGMKHANSISAKRTPTPEDIVRFKQLLDLELVAPEEFKNMNPYDPNLNMPNSLAAQLLSRQKGLISRGILGDPYNAQVYKALEVEGVKDQLKAAGIEVTKDISKSGPRLKAFMPLLKGEIANYMDREKKVPSSEDVDTMVNRLLRDSSRQRTFMGWGLYYPTPDKTPIMGTVREYEVPLTKDESDAMYREYQQWHPEDKSVKSADDIPAWRQQYWKANRRDRPGLETQDIETGR